MTVEQLFADYGPHQHIARADYKALYGVAVSAEGPVSRALAEAYRMAGTAGTDETLKRLVIPALATWDPTAGEAGAARRRIALRAALLADDPDLTRLADAMASPRARLLTRGRAEAGPTLEVAHEALLRVQPVKGWIEGFSVELRLRDELEREASEWQKAETRLIAARKQEEQPEQLEALQKELDAATAARRGPRLEAAMRLLRNSSFACLVGDKEQAYVDACEAQEIGQIDKQRRTITRAFVRPALQALEDGLNESALRLAAAGSLLANDLEMRLVPELWSIAVLAILQSRTRAVFKGHTSTFSPDGRRVATASGDHTARLWDAETGTEIAVLKGHQGSVTGAAFSPYGRRVATASGDHTARLWDAETGAEGAVLRGHYRSIWSVAFSPDDRRVATASGDHTARLWDARDGNRDRPLGRPLSLNKECGVRPDGRRVATASEDHTARLWDGQTGTEIAFLEGHQRSVLSAAFSPDGRRVATASEDRTARLWDGETGTEIAVLRGHQGSVLSAAFSPDGRRMATASDDGTARLWEVSRIAVVLKGRGLVLAAALARGIGLRTANERLDFLMQDAPDDMYAAALALLGDRARALEETIAALKTPLHPNCYLSPADFAAKFGSTPASTDRLGPR